MSYYQRRLRARGVGIGRPRVLRYLYSGEALALALWVQPYHPIMINAPWLGLVLAVVLAGRTWREPVLYVVAAGVTVAVDGEGTRWCTPRGGGWPPSPPRYHGD
jgi:hypothetical protein